MTFNRFKDRILELTKGIIDAKYVHTESRLENGELHVKKIIKTGIDAEKEIQEFKKKHFNEIFIDIEKIKGDV